MGYFGVLDALIHDQMIHFVQAQLRCFHATFDGEASLRRIEDALGCIVVVGGVQILAACAFESLTLHFVTLPDLSAFFSHGDTF